MDLATRPATPAEMETWLAGWRERWAAEYARTRTEPHTDRRVRRHTDSPDATVLRLLDAGQPAGFLALSTMTEFGAASAVLDDIFVEEPYRRRGIGTAAVRLAEEWARARAGRIGARTDGEDPAQRALMRGWTLGGQTMVKDLTGDGTGLPPAVAVRPMTEAEFPAWRAHLVENYGRAIADAGLMEPEEARVRAEEQTAGLLPHGVATDGHEILTVLYHDAPAGEI